MSAIIVLILRILMTVCLYSFLVIALANLNHETQQTIHPIDSEQIKGIVINLEGEPAKCFNQNEIRIGGDLHNDLQLCDDSVSSKHSRIFISSGQWMIEDLQSENGTYLNDQRISASTLLKENDIIRCGKSKIRINFRT
jgi:pSer/pThr/pTyr-binding forkhead associated (FHA) protein